MSAEYSVEEVRAMASDLRAAPGTSMIGTHISLPTAKAVAIYGALCAYAERIAADEGVVPVAELVVDRDSGGREWFDAKVLDRTLPHGTKLFARPPAQAAKVDEVESRLAAANALLRLCAGNVSNPLVIAIQNHLQGTAEPVAQGEAVAFFYIDKHTAGAIANPMTPSRDGVRAYRPQFPLPAGEFVPVYLHAAQPRAVPDGWRATRDDDMRMWTVHSPSGDSVGVLDQAAGVATEVLRQLAQDLAANRPAHPGGGVMDTWQVESSGPHTSLVIRRHHGIQQDLHRNERGRVVWFESKDAAQKVADELNGRHMPKVQ